MDLDPGVSARRFFGQCSVLLISKKCFASGQTKLYNQTHPAHLDTSWTMAFQNGRILKGFSYFPKQGGTVLCIKALLSSAS
jgi:hypothetical protein